MQLEFFLQNPRCRWAHCNERWVRNGSHLNQKNIHRKEGTYKNPGSKLLNRSLSLCLISPSAVVMERSLLIEHSGFDALFTVCEDFDLWLRVLSEEPLGFVDEVLVEKRGGHADQLSKQFHSMDWWRLKALHKSRDKLIPFVGRDFDLVFQTKLDILRHGLKKRGDEGTLSKLDSEFIKTTGGQNVGEYLK